MTATVGGLLIDPDSLGYALEANTAVSTKELVIDTTNKLIKLTRTGNLTADGVTLKCLYSKLKEVWVAEPTLTSIGFPFQPITDEQYDMINGWNFDKTLNPTTKIAITSVTGVSGQANLTISSGNAKRFDTANVWVGAKITGSGSLGANVTVTSVTPLEVGVSVVNSGTVSGTLYFYTDCDYTYNLIRTGGWSVKATTLSSSTEEWMSVISLGGQGEQGLNTTLTTTSATTNSNVVVVADTTGIISGSYVHAANVPFGTTVQTVDSTTQFTLTKTIGSLPIGAQVTVTSNQQPYYQIGSSVVTLPINTIRPGQVNQPIQIYGVSNPTVDLRSATVAKMFLREYSYSFALTTAADIGVSSLTYQTYRFSLTNIYDGLKITHSDATVAGSTPYTNMRIYWYDTNQQREIGGSIYNFKVIIDADITATGTYGSASAEQIYEFVQWSLRRSTNINSNGSTASKYGKTTRSLLEFQGDTLYTIYDSTDGGVYIDHFKKEDINSIVFSDNTNRQFPYVSFGTINFTGNIVQDGANAVYRLFYKQINLEGASRKFGNYDAVLVKAYSSDPSHDGTKEIRGNLEGSLSTVSFDFDFDSNPQLSWQANTNYKAGDQYGYRAGSTTTYYQVKNNYTSGLIWDDAVDGLAGNSVQLDNGPTVVLTTLGLNYGQYYTIEANIAKSNTNTIAAVPLEELNYAEYSYSALSGTNITGSGTGATFDVIARGTNYTIYINGQGTGYAVSNRIKILGTQLGLTTPTNDVVITVTALSNVTVGNISTISWA